MNFEDITGGVGGSGEPVGGDAAAVRGLGELAESAEFGPAPYDRLIAGGRRRLRRRRLLTTGAVAVLVAAAVGGGTALGGLGGGRAGGTAVAAGPAATGSVPAASTSAASAVATATAAVPARDPFTPVRVMVGHGTANGKEWQAWAALWPAADKEQAFRQAQLEWEDRHAAIPQLPPPTEADALRRWKASVDHVNLYLTVDGKRQVSDTAHDTPAPSAPGAGSLTGGVSPQGALLGFKGGEMGSSPVLVAGVRPDVVRAVATWADGSTTEGTSVAAGDSPVRWIAIAKKPGVEAEKITFYGADGAVLGTDHNWFH
ncbi:hypothetical protein ACFVHB_28260 [Kitasatospora sp. NPDC127111]|uniref:hypothetical protein n=1 Tax=Kitasatospora sp. NPDC127111 TaxID=3345363 RepID=UPI003635D84D